MYYIMVDTVWIDCFAYKSAAKGKIKDLERLYPDTKFTIEYKAK